MDDKEVAKFFNIDPSEVDKDTRYFSFQLNVSNFSSNNIIYTIEQIEKIKSSKPSIYCYYSTSKQPLGAINTEVIPEKVIFDLSRATLHKKNLKLKPVPTIKKVQKRVFDHLPSIIKFPKNVNFSSSTIEKRLKVYNNLFYNYNNNPRRFFNSVPLDMPEAKMDYTNNSLECNCDNCVSFFSFISLVLSKREDLLSTIIDFEILLLEDNQYLLFDGNQKEEYEMEVIDYIKNDSFHIEMPVFKNGKVIIDKAQYLKSQKEKYKKAWLGLFEQNRIKIQQDIELDFISQIDALHKKRKTEGSILQEITIKKEKMPTIQKAHEDRIMPPCALNILDQIKKQGKADYTMRYALGIIYDFGYSIEDILDYLKKIISSDKFEDEAAEITRNYKKYWKDSNTIRRHFIDSKIPNDEKIKVAGRGCFRMIYERQTYYGSTPFYACPLAVEGTLKTYSKDMEDMEDLLEISKKKQIFEEDIKQVKKKCSEISFKKHGVHMPPNFYHPYQQYMLLLINRQIEN